MKYRMLEAIAGIFSSGDTSRVGEFFASDYVDHQRPEWMAEEGPDEFRAIVNLARSSMPNLTVKILGRALVDGDLVAGRFLWTSDGIERETIEMLRMVDGRIAEHWGAESWSQPKDDSTPAAS